MISRSDRPNPIEPERQAIQAAIDATKTAAERNRLGQFATPNSLAVEIARFVGRRMVRKNQRIRFADPSIGTGSFFSAVLSVYGRKRIESAIGVEIDPAFASAAKNLWNDVNLEIVCDDFTRFVARRGSGIAPNLILANPPYVRHHHIGRGEKLRLQQLTYATTGIEVNGLAGLYVYFLLLATAWMENEGYAAWLIPSEFMDVKYGAALKQFLVDRVTLIRAHRFDPSEVQFDDALVSSVVLVLRKTPPQSDHQPEFSFGGTLAQPHACDKISLEGLRTSHKWTVFPSHAKNDRSTISSGDDPVLADLFRVQRGIATGNNKFFVLERSDAKRRGLPVEYLRPILPSPRFLKETIIVADNDGYPAFAPQLCVIDCDLPEDIVELRHPELWEYLCGATALGVTDGYLVRNRRPWYKQEHREPSPFLCTYMGRGSEDRRPFRFIWNRSNAIATNLYLMLYPVSPLKAMLAKHPDRQEAVYELLNQVTGHELRGEGRVYGGGLNKIEPSELGRISAAPFLDRWPELRLRREKQTVLF